MELLGWEFECITQFYKRLVLVFFSHPFTMLCSIYSLAVSDSISADVRTKSTIAPTVVVLNCIVILTEVFTH